MLKNLCGTIILLALLGCTQRGSLDKSNKTTLNVIGHGGAGSNSSLKFLPYNSLASIRAALTDFGADGVEVDVQMTADSVLVLFHDQHLDKATNCMGMVSERTYQELMQCHYTRPWLSLGNEKHRIITLRELYELIGEIAPGVLVVLDLKPYFPEGTVGKQELMVKKVAEAVSGHRAENQTYLESTNIHLLNLLKSKNDQLILYYYTNDPIKGIKKIQEEGFEGLTIKYNLITPEQVEDARQKGIKVALFGTRSNFQHHTALKRDPDYIQTDNIPYLKTILVQ